MGVLEQVLGRMEVVRILRGIAQAGGVRVTTSDLRHLHGWGGNEMSEIKELGLVESDCPFWDDTSRPSVERRLEYLTITDLGREFLSALDVC